MKITRRQLRKIIKESLLLEAEMLPIMVNPYEDLDTMNRVANYALTNDIQGALADEMVNYENLEDATEEDLDSGTPLNEDNDSESSLDSESTPVKSGCSTLNAPIERRYGLLSLGIFALLFRRRS